jgi:uncharacterized membrane protein (UPF0127 family)
MEVRNNSRGTSLGEAIEVANTAALRVKGLLGRDALEDGHGLLFKGCSSLHTFFMTFPIDIIFLDKAGKVLKTAADVKPFKLVAAPFKAYYAIELPSGVIDRSVTKVGDLIALPELAA